MKRPDRQSINILYPTQSGNIAFERIRDERKRERLDSADIILAELALKHQSKIPASLEGFRK